MNITPVRKAVLRYMNASDSPAGSYCSPQLGHRAYSVYVHQRRKTGPAPQRGHFIRSPRQKIWRAVPDIGCHFEPSRVTAEVDLPVSEPIVEFGGSKAGEDVWNALSQGTRAALRPSDVRGRACA